MAENTKDSEKLLTDETKEGETYGSVASRQAEERENNESNSNLPSSLESTGPLTSKFSYRRLFCYSESFDWLLIILGAISAIVTGLSYPALFFLFGIFANQLTNYGRFQQCFLDYHICFGANLTLLNKTQWNLTTGKELNSLHEANSNIIFAFVFVGIGMLVSGTVQVITWSYIAIRNADFLKAAFFESVIKQDMTFHDILSSADLNNQLASDIQLVQEGIGTRLGLFIQHVTMAAAGIVVGLVFSYRITLIVLACSATLWILSCIFTRISLSIDNKQKKATSEVTSMAETAIVGIKTVTAFGLQNQQVERYVDHLNDAKSLNILRGFFSGFTRGLFYLCWMGMYGLTFWYGTRLVVAGEMNVGQLTISVFETVIFVYALGMASRFFQFYSKAKISGRRLFTIIDLTPEIDISANYKPNPLNGDIVFEGVHFRYPTNPSSYSEILTDVSFSIERGCKVALVSQRRSTLIAIKSLIQRFYDCSAGSIKLGEKNIKCLNLSKYREMVGIIEQKPKFFDATIAENIRWGNEGVTNDDIVKATKLANIYEFIINLPKKFYTKMGENGIQLREGEIRRIAIARAIARKPKILIVDDVTSGLEEESRLIVEGALGRACSGRTVILISRRLSEIYATDKVVIFCDGKVIGEGKHDLLNQLEDGIYSNSSDTDTEIKFLDDNEDAKNEIPLQLLPTTINDDKIEANKEDSEQSQITCYQLFQLAEPQWLYMTIACFFTGISGIPDPVTALLFGALLHIVIKTDTSQQNYESMIIGLLFLLCGLIVLVTRIIEGILFAKFGTQLEDKLRKTTFRTILRQDIAFFDDRRNSTINLLSLLSAEVTHIQNFIKKTLKFVTRNLFVSGIAIVIALAYGWELGLVGIVVMPFVSIGSYFIVNLHQIISHHTLDTTIQSEQVLNDSLKQIKTVASLTAEKKMHDLYVSQMKTEHKSTLKIIFLGIIHGLSQTSIHWAFAALFRLGLHLVEKKEIDFSDVFVITIALMFGALTIGHSTFPLSNLKKAKTGAAEISSLLNRKPDIDAFSNEGISPAHCMGEISFQSVSFSYPFQLDVEVLKNFSINVQPGKTLALVDVSKCGNPISLQLIERFFDPQGGVVTLDGVDVRTLNISWLRQQIGWMSQEMILFDGSVRDNIRFNKSSNDDREDNIEEVAKIAGIYDFIMSLPEDFSTKLSAMEDTLSLDIKQRFIIARTLARNPRILLYEEALFDSDCDENFAQIMKAAKKGRTCIVISHRLSTVRDADQIVVIDDGKVVEVGTHDELLERREEYFNLMEDELLKTNQIKDEVPICDQEVLTEEEATDKQSNLSDKDLGLRENNEKSEEDSEETQERANLQSEIAD